AQPKLRALHQARRAHDAAHGARSHGLPEALEAELYLRQEAARMRTPRRKQWLTVLAVTALAFGISVLGWLEPLQVLVIAAVLLFHELGHWAAMRAFGYRDARIFFIPFFGAAAAGSKKNVSLTEELVVLFAGPLPGILLALVLDLALPSLRGDHTFGFVVFTLVGLNALNLLPVYPLDGGKIVDALVFAQRPTLVVVFRVGAAVLLFAGAIAATDLVLAFVGLLVVLNVPLARRAARLERAVQEARATNSEDPLLLVVQTARRLGYANIPLTTRFAIFRQVRERFERGRTRVWQSVSWLALYSTSLVGTVAAVAWIGVGAMLGPREPKMYEPSRFSESVACGEVHGAIAGALEPLARARRPEEQLMASFVCDVGSEAEVARIVDALSPLKLGSREQPIRPPWSRTASTADAEREIARARRTFVAYERARTAAYLELVGGSRVEHLRRITLGPSANDFGARHRALQASLERFAEDAAARPELDGALAAELVARGGVPSAELVRRLGALPTIDEGGRRRVHPDHAGEACTMVQAFAQGSEALVVAHAEDRAPLEALARWLCEAGCTRLRHAAELTAWLDELPDEEP
ncbi:site-2 protease family protein, partial [Myxococcota bacterium]|nr:site-2 protease family protein [Myxococcota bacterium]